MAKQDYIFRYLTIIRKLRSAGSATFAELAEYIREESAGIDRPVSITVRTFQRDISDISRLFHVTISYDFSRKVYFIEEDEKSDFNNRMLESIDTINTLRMADDLLKFLWFEKRKAQGTHHLHGMLHAIRNRIVLSLIHRKYDGDESTTRDVAPYGLKESRGRWYLVAKDREDKRIKTFGLDRVLDFQHTPRRFDAPAGFDVNHHFRYCFGVINPEDERPETIILSFDAEQGKYIRSYPLHESQRILTDNDDELRISLKLYVTYDLIQEILSYGDRVEIIAPETLRHEVTRIVRHMLEKLEGISRQER